MSFPLKLIPKIVVGQMALQITRVVKDPNNIDHGFASAAVDQKMSRLFDYAQVTPGPIAAEEQVIRSDARSRRSCDPGRSGSAAMSRSA